ncbi:MAG: hypothetical protein JRH14_17090 [Deltaproteobacteria bacterium]|nr:hypothetical protein [Deltaproteobacteria bacterium]
MKEVVVLGVGMHRFGKTGDGVVGHKSVTELCRHAVDAAIKDAGVSWKQIEAVSAASSRFSGGKGWGLNGNDVVEDLGSTGIPVYNLSAGCAAGGNAFNVGYSMVAGLRHHAGGGRRSNAQGHDSDLRYRRSERQRVPAPATDRYARAVLLVHPGPSSHA